MLPKLDLACSKNEFKISHQYVKVSKEYVVATDAHILVYFNTGDVFGSDFTETIEGDFYIHFEDWKKIIKGEVFSLDGDTLTAINPKANRPVLIRVDRDINYPKWISVIPSEGMVESINSIKLDSYRLDIIAKIIDPLKRGLELTFNGKSRPIGITSIDSEHLGKAIIMPKL